MLDLETLAAAQIKSPNQFAVVVEREINPDKDGTWSTERNQSIWRYVLRVPRAESLALRAQKFIGPSEAHLLLREPSKQNEASYRPSDVNRHGQLWIRHFPGDTLEMELRVPAGRKNDVTLVVDRLYAGVSGAQLPQGKQKSSAADPHRCDLNYSCVKGPANERAGRATVWWTSENRAACSGTLIHAAGDTETSITPMLITADHCPEQSDGSNPRQQVAESLVLYFKRETRCGDPLKLIQDVSGPAESFDGDALYWWQDSAIFKLNKLPARETEAYFAGFNFARPPVTQEWEVQGDRRSNVVANIYQSDLGAVFNINHSAARTKQFRDIPLEELVEVQDYSAARDESKQPVVSQNNGSFVLYPGKNRLGTSRGGASGSGLFDAQQRLLGTLSGGGPNSCEEWEDPDRHPVLYSIAFQSIYPAWDHDRLASAVDPRGTGLRTVDGLEPDYPPTAGFISQCTGLTCRFDASKSADDRALAGYDWDFGGSSLATGKTVEHTFANAGTFTVTLQVTDSAQQRANSHQSVNVTPSPLGGKGGAMPWFLICLALLRALHKR